MRDMPVIETFSTRDSWAEACAARIMETLVQAVEADGAAFFAGSGGSTPSPIYRRMAGVGGVDWSRITTTLIDERYVPETSPDSNARLLKETLLTGEAAAARAAAIRLRRIVRFMDRAPTFDRLSANPRP